MSKAQKIYNLFAWTAAMVDIGLSVFSRGKCKCGNPPYTDGTPCDVCFAVQMQDKLRAMVKKADRILKGGIP